MNHTGWIITSVVFLGISALTFVVGKIMAKQGWGYNSLGRSMASAEAQNFASCFYGRLIVKLTPGILAITVIAVVLGYVHLESDTVQMVIILVLTTMHILMHSVAVVLTETTLRRHFDKNGKALE